MLQNFLWSFDVQRDSKWTWASTNTIGQNLKACKMCWGQIDSLLHHRLRLSYKNLNQCLSRECFFLSLQSLFAWFSLNLFILFTERRKSWVLFSFYREYKTASSQTCLLPSLFWFLKRKHTFDLGTGIITMFPHIMISLHLFHFSIKTTRRSSFRPWQVAFRMLYPPHPTPPHPQKRKRLICIMRLKSRSRGMNPTAETLSSTWIC